ncbi:MAG: methyltransferase domain-containing protein [Candidatus Accumulibacter sp.]|uniref:class I SAM-dependent methyltransferase n=1 Tax=Accumulibacter sp. TaxID=2053492 RepID=UPI002878CA71|nr:methyltransferase domain-containing protein [Accumulibacter sp.]MDS4013421.1 methyltransferase domain-containing protein [Accumulibacter sp.]
MSRQLSPGDFTGLAKDYSRHRPDYSPSVLKALLGLLNKPADAIDFADIGAGTGIWTRMVYAAGVKSIVAVEPNEDMRSNGIADCRHTSIRWLAGNAEQTSLPTDSVDWLTMASSFHWADFETATREFHRVLRQNGRFCALWNPRLIEVNPLLVEIEAHLDTLRPNIKRVSSGRSGITETLTEQLWASPYFDDVVYLEGRHVIEMTPARYLGAWRSVNDLRVQLGPEKFDAFLSFVEQRIADLNVIEATYLTRAWSARRRD